MPLLGPRPSPRPKHCRDEQIGKTRERLCHKQSQSVAELLANACKNCGRPFTPEGLIGGETPPEGGSA